MSRKFFVLDRYYPATNTLLTSANRPFGRLQSMDGKKFTGKI